MVEQKRLVTIPRTNGYYDNWKDRLIKAFKDTEAVLTGIYRLSSGQTSNYYIDARRVTLHFDGLSAIVAAVEQITEDNDLKFDSIGGPTLGADPIVSALISEMYSVIPVEKGFLVRKKSKDHGTQKLIEGHITKDYLLVEDVITTGQTLLNCIEIIGRPPVATVTVLDRSEGEIREYCKAINIGYFPLLTLEDLGVQRN